MSQFGEWAQSQLASADIACAFIEPLSRHCPEPQSQYWIVNPEFYLQIRSTIARQWWREAYRAARVLGNSQLAFDRVGNRRMGF